MRKALYLWFSTSSNGPRLKIKIYSTVFYHFGIFSTINTFSNHHHHHHYHHVNKNIRKVFVCTANSRRERTFEAQLDATSIFSPIQRLAAHTSLSRRPDRKSQSNRSTSEPRFEILQKVKPATQSGKELEKSLHVRSANENLQWHCDPWLTPRSSRTRVVT